MPKGKKVSSQERAYWLESYERGKTMIQIAEETGRSDSTVSKGIRQAQDERTRGVARADMYRTTLEAHNRAMIAALGRHKERLAFRPAHQIASSYSHPGQGGLSPADFPFEEDRKEFKRRSGWHAEGVNGLENELVREHLANRVTMWRSYDRWLDGHARYLWQVWRLSVEATAQFQSKSGLQPGREGESYWPACSIKLVEAAIEMAKKGTSEIVQELKVRGGSLESGLSTLAASDSRGKLNRAKKAFVEAVGELVKGEDAKEVDAAETALQEKLPVIRRQFELIQVMGIVEGTCEACKPYVK